MRYKTWIRFQVCSIVSVFLLSSTCRADSMKSFLLDCAYGTAAGALVGLATVAMSDKPSENGMNIARGASLGLYAGIGFGLYDLEQAHSSQSLWIEPLIHGNEHAAVEGARANWLLVRF